jgi:hypothetical protein
VVAFGSCACPASSESPAPFSNPREYVEQLEPTLEHAAGPGRPFVGRQVAIFPSVELALLG